MKSDLPFFSKNRIRLKKKPNLYYQFRSIFGILLLFIGLLGLEACSSSSKKKKSAPVKLTSYVDPFIGTGGHGHVYPGATVPFGMVQLSPDNGKSGWDYCSGYNYASHKITGFTLTHLSGTGIGDLCDISFMPTNWAIDKMAGKKINKWNVSSTFSHKNEHAVPGYYSVVLNNNNIKVELTAAERAGFYRYTFPKTGPATLSLNLGFAINWDHPTSTYIHVENDSTVSGYRMSTGWAKDQRVYFVAKFSRPFEKFATMKTNKLVEGQNEVKGDSVKALFSFAPQKGQILEKVGISAVSIDGARQNLKSSIPGWNFDAVRKKASDIWEKNLDRVKVATTDSSQKVKFYTALYHTMLAPTIFSDVNGKYQGANGKDYTAKNFTNYTTFSLWDTYRAEDPLFTIVEPDRINDMVHSFLAFYEQHGLLPVWPLVGNETNTMIGYHAVPVIVDAYLRGFRDYDVQEAYKAMKKSAEEENKDVKAFNKKGYVPSDKFSESVSKTLEYAYDDWCIAQMAKALGKKDDYKKYMKRAGYYKNLYDPSTKFMRPKLANGHWETPFDPLASPTSFKKRDYTEANAWQYNWYVPQDVPELINLMGGDDAFVSRLDTLFNMKTKTHGKIADMSGLIGQYVQGNEPDMQTPYMYNYAGAPWKTQAIVRKIMSKLYKDATNGLPGNEDCGQMSAWYVFSALGFYPVNPVDGKFVMGSPVFDKASVKVPGGKFFTLITKNNSKTNKYIQSAELNGKPYDNSYITYQDIMKGGTLILDMGPKPNKKWGTVASSRP